MPVDPKLALGALEIFRGFQDAEAIDSTARVNRLISQINVDRLEYEAYERERYGQELALRQVGEADKVIGAQRAAFASKGVDVSGGTARAVQAESRLTARLNAIDIEENARRQAFGIRRRSVDLGLTSRLLDVGTSAKKSRAISGAISSGLEFYMLSQGKG